MNGNRNVSVNVHVNASVKCKGNRRLRRLVSRRERRKDKDSSDESRSCSKRDIVYATWKRSELIRGNNVSVRGPKQGERRG